jgi:hypothetical protein
VQPAVTTRADRAAHTDLARTTPPVHRARRALGDPEAIGHEDSARPLAVDVAGELDGASSDPPGRHLV